MMVPDILDNLYNRWVTVLIFKQLKYNFVILELIGQPYFDLIAK